ncbi:hypothetical protein AB1N83_004795, partial [Pleurotus pulmonarius]
PWLMPPPTTGAFHATTAAVHTTCPQTPTALLEVSLFGAQLMLLPTSLQQGAGQSLTATRHSQSRKSASSARTQQNVIVLIRMGVPRGRLYDSLRVAAPMPSLVWQDPGSTPIRVSPKVWPRRLPAVRMVPLLKFAALLLTPSSARHFLPMAKS